MQNEIDCGKKASKNLENEVRLKQRKRMYPSHFDIESLNNIIVQNTEAFDFTKNYNTTVKLKAKSMSNAKEQ